MQMLAAFPILKNKSQFCFEHQKIFDLSLVFRSTRALNLNPGILQPSCLAPSWPKILGRKDFQQCPLKSVAYMQIDNK